jgi:hypothetical protein
MLNPARRHKCGRAIFPLMLALLLAATALLWRPPTDAHARPYRSIAGSTLTLSPSFYSPGLPRTFTLTAHDASTDTEWLDQVQVTLPGGWTASVVSQDTQDSCGHPVSFSVSGSGSNQITFSTSAIGPGCDWQATLSVTVPGSATGNQTVNWALSGTGTGSTPHDINGSLSLTPALHTYLPLLTRDYGEHRFAVIIGISDYQDQAIPDLDYPDDDANAFYQELLADGGFAAGNMRLLLNSQATKTAIQDAILNWLDSRENETDVVVIFFAGHGTRGYPSGEPDGYDEYLLPYNFNGYANTAIRDDELDGWLDGLEAGRVIVIADSCFSGGLIGTAGVEGMHCRCLPPLDDSGTDAPRDGGFIRHINQNGRLVLAASAENESSWESSVLKHGVYTFYLLQALETSSADTHDANGWISGEEAHDYLYSRVVAYTKNNQHPQRSDNIPGEADLARP